MFKNNADKVFDEMPKSRRRLGFDEVITRFQAVYIVCTNPSLPTVGDGDFEIF